jgi:hypothetical protein
MNSVGSKRFWDCFDALPSQVQRQAEGAYRLWRADPHHPSVQYKRIPARLPIFSVRIGLHWRAVGVEKGDTIV